MTGEKPTSYDLGRSGEEIALRFLKKKGYRIIGQSFRMFRGEIDIIAFDRKTLVFVEVKTRKSREYGSPEESVTSAKQEQLRKIASGFLVKSHLQDVECRFDVISVLFNPDGSSRIQHFRNAF